MIIFTFIAAGLAAYTPLHLLGVGNTVASPVTLIVGLIAATIVRERRQP